MYLRIVLFSIVILVLTADHIWRDTDPEVIVALLGIVAVIVAHFLDWYFPTNGRKGRNRGNDD